MTIGTVPVTVQNTIKVSLPNARQQIATLLLSGWQVFRFALTEAAVTGGIATVQSRLSLYTLPVSRILFGAWIRSLYDEKSERGSAWVSVSRKVIFVLAVDYAIERHLEKYPNSTFREPSSPIGIRIPATCQLAHEWELLARTEFTYLTQEIDNWKFIDGKLLVSHGESPEAREWDEWVMKQFDRISYEFAELLERGEHSIRGIYSSWLNLLV